jgi:hypothetical protein
MALENQTPSSLTEPISNSFFNKKIKKRSWFSKVNSHMMRTWRVIAIQGIKNPNTQWGSQ